MSQDETAFDTLITEFSQNIRQIEAVIESAPAGGRPEIERKLTDVLASVAHLNPLGDRSAALLDAPSRDGVYARANMREDQLVRLDDDAVKARLSEALQGTGIDPEAVAARMREGAGNAALERQWLAQDLRAIAKAGDLDLEKGEDREEALDRLEAFDVTLLAREYRALGASAPRDFLWVNLILAGSGVAALMLSVTLLGDALTRFGTTHWQTRGEMKRNGFFAKPGGGFLLGKLGPPKSKRPFLVSKTFPHALIVAPTGRGKGVGFVIPNLLTYKGSAVVLDVKGENFRETSRFRASMGDKVSLLSGDAA